MNKNTTNNLLIALIFTALPLAAGTIPFDFSAPYGTLGSSYAYVDGGVTIIARGYSGIGTPGSPASAANLFGKNGGGDESGLGMAIGSDHEIVGSYFIQLDFTDVKSKMPNATAQLMIGSVQSGESYRIYASNSVGVAGTMLIGSGTLDDKFFAAPDFNKYSFYSVSAPHGDVLLNAVSIVSPHAAVPEPGTLTLFAGGLILIGLSRRARAVIWLRR